MDEASKRENRRWWLLWRRRPVAVPVSSENARIMRVVEREGQLGTSATYCLNGHARRRP
jgi:hypothetical protein